MSILPKSIGVDGPRIAIMRPGSFDTKKFTYTNIMRMVTTISDVLVSEDDNVVLAGIICVMDMSNFSKEHIWQMELDLMKGMQDMQQYQPITPLALHCVNAPWAVRSFLNIMKGFMTEEMKKAVSIINLK